MRVIKLSATMVAAGLMAAAFGGASAQAQSERLGGSFLQPSPRRLTVISAKAYRQLRLSVDEIRIERSRL